MATLQHVELIQQGAMEWNRWRSANPAVHPDLSGAELPGANLYGANLCQANLIRANLCQANLSGAFLAGADLGGAYLVNAFLVNVNLREANLVVANLCWADLSGADLSLAVFAKTVIGCSNLSGAKGLETCVHSGPSILDHRTFARSGGSLPLSFLRGCGLSEVLIGYLRSLVNNSVEFYSCFISYAHADKAFARLLHDTLQGRGVRCWLDEKQLLPGDDIYEHVDRGVRLWDKLLLCCSDKSLTSWWVDNEIGKAFVKEQTLMKERGTKVHVLVPLNLDGYLFSGKWTSGKASQVLERLAADFQGWDRNHSKFEQQVESVIRALRADDYAREAPPKSRF